MGLCWCGWLAWVVGFDEWFDFLFVLVWWVSVLGLGLRGLCVCFMWGVRAFGVFLVFGFVRGGIIYCVTVFSGFEG